jgi:hypothetical protein
MMMYHDQAKNSKVCRAFAEIGDNSTVYLTFGQKLKHYFKYFAPELKKIISAFAAA